MGIYHDPIENRDFYAPDREPTVDLPFQLMHISGLDNYFVPRNALVRRPAGVKPPATTGSCPGASFCGSDMRAAYYEGTALTGKGQIIGLLEFAGFDIADVNTYYTNPKRTQT
jgi:kumamolisin